MRLSLRSVLFRLHWALGLTAGLVLALMGATGAMMSYEESITDLLNPGRAAVAVSQRPTLGPDALMAGLAAQNARLRVSSLTLSAEPGTAVWARFAADASGKRPASVFLDPYTGAVLGEVTGEAAFATIRELHRWLLIPGQGKGWGRTITGACGLTLLVFLATGLYLRWPKIHRWRIWLKPQLARPGRPRWWSLHAVLGTWLMPVYLIIILSGLCWSYDWYRTGATWLLTGKPPAARADRPARRNIDGPMALDAAWKTFQDGEGRDAGTALMMIPGPQDAAIRIRWYARHAVQKARNEISFDRVTGALIESARDADKPFGQRIADNMLAVHRGQFFGAPFTLLFALAALAMPLFAATGITLYVLRRRAGRRNRAPARIAEPALLRTGRGAVTSSQGP
ncbi:PepSY-associated TM helix domain-containing protein [Methylobacterium brachythecii]|uniref:Membrane protein n=1 Tax=Methylobacterium brachythecii TaxID=1176177 RepID=A0A7W6AHL2_9HYPH|nr:PepSY-associated TM helix domain-containing protein [Methylobacterium brachythecii]MBB3902878.1 sulfite reductase (NADPH) flavoprotein alpha-component [Methylobacterium brachythecii]GLS43805.1 membrane protein [Methylobacterium brachythecii]